ncbi:MAG: VanZ family protein, partial [Acidobacteria bacterium]|nr:VanZ family protein [Acidobacteriota bacterium]
MGDVLRSRGFAVLAFLFAAVQLATLSRAPAIWLEEIQPRLGPHPLRIFAVAGAFCLAFLFAWAFRAPRNRGPALLGLLFVLGAYALILLVYFGSADAPAKRAHLLQYGVLGVLTFQAVRVSSRDPRGLILGLLFVLAVGAVDET